jgi:hypothetical protein
MINFVPSFVGGLFQESTGYYHAKLLLDPSLVSLVCPRRQAGRFFRISISSSRFSSLFFLKLKQNSKFLRFASHHIDKGTYLADTVIFIQPCR